MKSNFQMTATLTLAVLLTGLTWEALCQVHVVNFDDLGPGEYVTGTHYAGLNWEVGNQGWQNGFGWWCAEGDANTYPQSRPNDVVNLFGASLMGIGFPSVVNVEGAYFAGQASSECWTSGVRVHGYLQGAEVATTDWFANIGSEPAWFAMNLNGVDRIVIESKPAWQGGGWYGMDDLTYSVPEPTPLALAVVSVVAWAFLRARRLAIRV